MQRFLGRHAKRIDSKGRVSIPAPFRAILVADAFEGLFCVRSLFHPAVDAGGKALIDAIDTAIGGYDAFSPDHLDLATTLLGAGDTLTIDGEGRIVVPDWIRETTGIGDEIVFVGIGTRFQIWAPDVFTRREAEARGRALQLMGTRASSKMEPAP
jgi:MraZ protein